MIKELSSLINDIEQWIIFLKRIKTIIIMYSGKILIIIIIFSQLRIGYFNYKLNIIFAKFNLNF